MNQNQTSSEPALAVFWMIWAAILSGVFFLQFFIAGGIPSGENTEDISNGLLLTTLAGVGVSTLMRWFILPRVESAQSLLTTMIIGVALAESTGLLGIFLIGSDFPSSQKLAFVLSVLGILQYAPFYAAQIVNKRTDAGGESLRR